MKIEVGKVMYVEFEHHLMRDDFTDNDVEVVIKGISCDGEKAIVAPKNQNPQRYMVVETRFLLESPRKKISTKEEFRKGDMVMWAAPSTLTEPRTGIVTKINDVTVNVMELSNGFIFCAKPRHLIILVQSETARQEKE